MVMACIHALSPSLASCGSNQSPPLCQCLIVIVPVLITGQASSVPGPPPPPRCQPTSEWPALSSGLSSAVSSQDMR